MPASQLSIARIDTRNDSAREQLCALREKLSVRGDIVSEAGRKLTLEVFGAPLTPQQVVERICGDVQQQGLSALLKYCHQLDRAELSAEDLRVPKADLEAAHAAADPEFLATIGRIRDNILAFQTAILHRDVEVPAPGGGTLRQRYLPLQRVGLCIPGGAAAYPSTVLMTAVPAQAAGVQELAVVAPPTPFGAYNPDLLATCHALGITEVYRMGGAQAVAALAYGAEGVPRVDKIVGPGNLFVALAKKHVFGEVDIDSIAGPSEVVVIADEHARAHFVAAEMIAQAEHSPGSSVLITWSDELLAKVEAELKRQLAQVDRGELALASLQSFGALVRVPDRAAAAKWTNELAPEHLHIATREPRDLLEKIHNVGASFLGDFSPVALGDYVAGPSHVLPTGGTARFASGLSSNSFLRSSSVIEFDAAGLEQVAPDAESLAAKEGLTAHLASVRIRRKS